MDPLTLLHSAGSAGSGSHASAGVDDVSALMNTALLADRNKAFELFRKSYRQNEVRVGCGFKAEGGTSRCTNYFQDRGLGLTNQIAWLCGGIQPRIAHEGKGG